MKDLIKRIRKILQKVGFGQASAPRPFNCEDQDAERWKERAREAASLWIEALNEDGAMKAELRIADFGCGDQKLKTVLTTVLGPANQYFGYDLNPQSSAVEFCDFETMVPAGPFDAIFCLGLLEYVENLDGLLAGIRQACRYAVVSFVNMNPAQLSAKDLEKRGWVSQYSPDELSEKSTASGFTIRKTILVNKTATALWLLKVDRP